MHINVKDARLSFYSFIDDNCQKKKSLQLSARKRCSGGRAVAVRMSGPGAERWWGRDTPTGCLIGAQDGSCQILGSAACDAAVRPIRRARLGCDGNWCVDFMCRLWTRFASYLCATHALIATFDRFRGCKLWLM